MPGKRKASHDGPAAASRSPQRARPASPIADSADAVDTNTLPAVLDFSGFPHIVEEIFAYSSWSTRLAFRATSRYFHSLLDLSRLTVSTRPIGKSSCMIEVHTPSGFLVAASPCTASLRKQPMWTCDGVLDGDYSRRSFRSFLHFIEITGLCTHRPQTMSKILTDLANSDVTWNKPLSLGDPAPEPVAEPPRRMTRAAVRRAAAGDDSEDEEEQAKPRLPCMVVIPDKNGRVCSPPSSLEWVHVFRENWRAKPSVIEAEWGADLYLFPITGREPDEFLSTIVSTATVVYDFSEWTAPADTANGGGHGRDDAPPNPRMLNFVAHIATHISSRTKVFITKLDDLGDKSWLDPLYVSGEPWDLCPHGSIIRPGRRMLFAAYLYDAVVRQLCNNGHAENMAQSYASQLLVVADVRRTWQSMVRARELLW